jgi:hypothetical protein
MECLPRNTAGREQSQHWTETMWAANSKTERWDWLLKLFGVHITPLHALGAGHGAIGFNVCPVGFPSIFLGPIHPFYAIITSIGMFTYCNIVHRKYAKKFARV